MANQPKFQTSTFPFTADSVPILLLQYLDSYRNWLFGVSEINCPIFSNEAWELWEGRQTPCLMPLLLLQLQLQLQQQLEQLLPLQQPLQQLLLLQVQLLLPQLLLQLE